MQEVWLPSKLAVIKSLPTVSSGFSGYFLYQEENQQAVMMVLWFSYLIIKYQKKQGKLSFIFAL